MGQEVTAIAAPLNDDGLRAAQGLRWLRSLAREA